MKYNFQRNEIRIVSMKSHSKFSFMKIFFIENSFPWSVFGARHFEKY